MPSRRIYALVVVVVVAVAGMVWRSVHGRGSAPDRVLVRTLSTLAQQSETPIAVLSEGELVDAFIAASLRHVNAPRPAIVPRDVDSIEEAARKGTLLAGQSGREYLEALGYELSWLGQDASAPSFPFARVERRLGCAAVRGDAWSPLPGLEYTGRLGVVLPGATRGSMQLVVGDELPPDIDIVAFDGLHVRMRRETLASVSAAPPDYWIEGGSPHEAPGQIQRITIAASPGRSRLLSVRLGRRAPRVLARLQDYPDGSRAAVCAAPIAPDTAFADDANDFVLVEDFASHFGTGWSDVLLEPRAGSVRWMGTHAALLIRFARRSAVRVTLQAYRATDSGAGTVSLRINDTVDVQPQPLRPGMHSYEWTVPEPAWVAGTNEILLRVTGAGDERLLAFRRMTLARVR